MPPEQQSMLLNNEDADFPESIGLCPVELLSEVAFVRDYIQLVFQSQSFSIYNRAQLTQSGLTLTQGDQGFCDVLVGLIGRSVLQAHSNEQYKLVLEFENGEKFLVPSAAEYVCGPEAFQYNGANDHCVVEQN